MPSSNAPYLLSGQFFFAFFVLFGTVTILGGIQGYLNARSVASLVAGAVAGILLLFGASLLHLGYLRGGPILLFLVSLALLGRFTPSLLRGKLNPALYIVPLSLVGSILCALALFAGKL